MQKTQFTYEGYSKDFSNSLNKLEEDIQNNELLKYITDKNETRYYREYVDTYIKDMMYNNYIKSLSNYINDDEIEKNNDVLERITKIANKVNNDNKFSKRNKEIIDYDILKEISIQK